MDIVCNFVESSSLLYVSGIVTVTLVLGRFLYNALAHISIYYSKSRLDYKSFGKWALVTGATDGIGKGIARELAKRGLDLILIGRNAEKLEKVSQELLNEFPIEIKCIIYDYTYTDIVSSTFQTSSVYAVISEAIRRFEIGILVNNVGMGTAFLGEFLNPVARGSNAEEFCRDVINCNVTSTAKMTQLILTGMVKRRKGLVINLASGLALTKTAAYSALYSATKKFDDTFSLGLFYEYEKQGIIVQSVCPGLVATNMTSNVRSGRGSIYHPHYNTFASHLLETIGKGKRTAGYWFHDLLVSFWNVLPEKMSVYLFKVGGDMMLRKQSRERKDK